MDGGGDSLYPKNLAVIREIYDSEYAHEAFENELDQAIEAGCCVIVIEPTRLGDETARWITSGNCLHKTAVVTGFGAVLLGGFCGDRPLLYIPLGTLSLLSTTLYTICWQFDPCVKYQVERDPKKMIVHTTHATPVVLVRKDDTKRKILHCTISVISTLLCAFRIYQTIK